MASKLNKRLLRLLESEPLHASELARKLGVPRTTVAYRAKKFVADGLLKKSNAGRKVVYALQHKRKGEEVEIHEKETFHLAYQPLLLLPKRTIVYGVQGSAAAHASLESLPVSLIQDVHAYFKRNGLVLKLLSNRQVLKSVELSQELADSHKGRTLGARLIKGELFLSGAEAYCAPGLFVLANPVEKRAFVTKDPSMCELLHQVFALVYDSFEDIPSTDLDAWLDATKPSAS